MYMTALIEGTDGCIYTTIMALVISVVDYLLLRFVV